ncbi:MAG: OprO/OprP family phosphate-selective porin [Myxococcota bacterium]|nr:hypothetical protein [Deltaproteobacteria bacterium]MDQ3335098.1 OprO/OprP family phosphate-selective porin [Myxococcota bacterium]
MRTSFLVVLTTVQLAHAQPEPPPPDVPVVAPTPVQDEQLTVTYDRGLTFASRDGKFGLRIQFRNQLRFETTRPTEDNSQFASHFLIPRARLTVDGHVFGKTTRYRLESTFGDTGSFSFIRDLFVDQQLSPAKVWLRAGVWKRPFNRQELVSDFASEFNERAITATFAGGGRDLGLAIHNDYEKSPEGLEWVIGVFNAFNGGEDRPDIGGCTTNAMTGTTACPPPTNFPVDFGPTIVAHAGWNSGDIKGYSEGDLEGGPLRWAAGAAYKIDLANLGEGDEESVSDNLSHGLQVDGMLKASGVSVEVGAYMMKIKSADAGFGAFGQLGYMLVLKRVQAAGRFALAPDPRNADRDLIEARVAVNLFWQGHAWKWATDAGVLKTTGEDPMTMESDKPDFVLRSMLQLTL